MKSVNPNGNQETIIYIYLSRCSLMILIGLSTFIMGLWVSGCDRSNADSALTMEIKEEDKMDSTNSIATIKTRLPAMDAAAPAETRTATFALG